VGKLNRPLLIDDTPALTPTEVRSRARRVKREHGTIAMIMIDYLQLMQVAGASEGRTAEISEISRSLKAIAKEFRCPVVALSQLNRSLEQRPNKRPVNSDLRESGAIEQDADVIMFIYRDEVYNPDSPTRASRRSSSASSATVPSAPSPGLLRRVHALRESRPSRYEGLPRLSGRHSPPRDRSPRAGA
jgi:replicative DNA helicase